MSGRLVGMQTCDAAVIDSIGTVLWTSGTANMGVYPCQLQMRTDGTFAIVDAANTTIRVFGTPTNNGNNAVATLNSGRYLYQVIIVTGCSEKDFESLLD